MLYIFLIGNCSLEVLTGELWLKIIKEVDTMAYDYKRVLCAKGRRVLKVTMNQPETLNALTPDLEKDLQLALYGRDYYSSRVAKQPGLIC
jgi:hypothetical protein